MEFLQNKQDEIVEGLVHFFNAHIAEKPHEKLRQVESELKTLYIRFDNDWTGRGVVGDATLTATISGLEGVRAECLRRLETRNSADGDEQ
nr:hypothetical protein [uncultured Desulfuromonas sp.]